MLLHHIARLDHDTDLRTQARAHQMLSDRAQRQQCRNRYALSA